MLTGEFTGIGNHLMNDEISKNIITINAALKYAGISDFEFMKSSVLVWIVVGLCERFRNGFE